MIYRWEQNPPELHDVFGHDWQWKWPDEDESLAGDLPTLLHVPTEVFPYVPEPRRRVCLQAGGAIGAWPKYFSRMFEQVYTFEPYPPSFHCLTVNVPELNVYKFNAALGEKRGLVYMDFPEHRQRSETGKENIGGFRCFRSDRADLTMELANIPTLRIDDLELPVLDLLYLDLEGYELFALRGGIQTIARCRPTIVMEDKGGCMTYGHKIGDVEKYLIANVGYQTVKRFHGNRDVLMVG